MGDRHIARECRLRRAAALGWTMPTMQLAAAIHSGDSLALHVCHMTGPKLGRTFIQTSEWSHCTVQIRQIRSLSFLDIYPRSTFSLILARVARSNIGFSEGWAQKRMHGVSVGTLRGSEKLTYMHY